MLHEKTYERNAKPATGAQKDRFSACFDQFDKVAVEPNGCHRHNNKEF